MRTAEEFIKELKYFHMSDIALARIMESFAKERAVAFLLENIDEKPITDRDIRVFYENVYDEFIERND